MTLSRTSKEPFQLVITRYALDRLLYRLSSSAFKDRFVLKGALLFTHWTGQVHRPTRDLDLLGIRKFERPELDSVFVDLCNMEMQDGLVFQADTIKVEPIREDQLYGGERVTLKAKLGSAVIPLQVDIGFGDVVTPEAEIVEMPTLLGMLPAKLRAYSKETVIAEKVHAMAVLGLSNSRMKDYFDVWYLSRHFPFEGAILVKALSATFKRRTTEILDATPTGLTTTFTDDPDKQKQWRAFVARSVPEHETMKLSDVVSSLREFLVGPLDSARTKSPFTKHWGSGNAWIG